jgi:hypothetical protein
MHIYIIAWLLIGFLSAFIAFFLKLLKGWNDGEDIDTIHAVMFIPFVVLGPITTIILIHDETDFFKNKVIIKGRKK